MAGGERYRISTFWFWIIVLLLNEAAIILLFLPRSYLQETLTHEERMVTTQLSSETLDYVSDRTRNLFHYWFLDTGIVDASYTFSGYKGKDRFDDRGLGAWLNLRLHVFWLAIYLMLFRWLVMSVWLPGTAVLTLPLLVDGLSQREIRKYQFSYASPTVHRQTGQALRLLFALMILLPLMPLSCPPLAYPVAIGLGALALWIMLVNNQKRM
jgi:hypothetical protein